MQLNSCLINSFCRIWIKFEEINEHVSRIYFVNKDNKEVTVPGDIEIYNDIDRQLIDLTDNMKYYYVSNVGNYSIFVDNEHVLDFSHKSFWRTEY
jgi:hypothetical protein